LPANASRTAIIWSVVYGQDRGSVSGNILTLSAAGKVTVRATVLDGWAIGDNAWEEFDIEVIQAVENIANVPASAVVDVQLTLTGNVEPSIATNQSIIWDVISGPGNVSGNILNLTNDGIVIVRATIINGSAIGTNYVQFFSITVVRSVLSIVSNIPNQIYAGTPFTLSGTISPANATNRTIIWSVRNAGTSGAVITGNVLNTNAGGVVTITATIINGLAIGQNYTQDYNLNVLAQPFINLRMEDFNLTDQGRGVFDKLDPIILSKGAGDPETTKSYVIINAEAEFTNVIWRLGNIPLGAGNSLTLNALNFNNGNYTLTMSFTYNGAPWLASLPFTVTN
jgi:endo-1,4-beta-xylanase